MSKNTVTDMNITVYPSIMTAILIFAHSVSHTKQKCCDQISYFTSWYMVTVSLIIMTDISTDFDFVDNNSVIIILLSSLLFSMMITVVTTITISDGTDKIQLREIIFNKCGNYQ